MPAVPTRLLKLPPADRLQVEAWLAAFEEEWDADCLDAWAERLPPPGQPLRLPALIELVKIDLERHGQCGRRPALADYAARYPELGPADALPPDLVQAAAEVCRQCGELPVTVASLSAGVVPDDRTLSPSAPTAEVPVPCVPGYDVLGKLGQGAMGAVYKAHHLRLNRVVALKVVRDAPSARPEDLVRFRREAELIARLQHANIVQIYEVGEYAGGSYLALEYVDGPTLDRQLGGTPQPPREAARLIEVVARAVHYAHGQGVVHRDLKPANVLLTGAGAPKVADFGLARHAEAESGLTTTGTVMGTPNYMAPEQAEGRLDKIGPHTDTYALGAILYECLTGRPPFQGATVLDTLMQVREQEPVPPHRLLGSSNRSCPADVETICLKCLEKDARRRYASAGALGDDLARYLAGEPIAARPVGPAGRAWRWARRNPGWAAMLAAVAGLLLLIAVGSALSTLRINQALRASEAERWVTLVEQARAGSRSRERGQRFDGLAAIRQALGLPVPSGHSVAELRNEAIACLVLPDVEPAGPWWEGWPTGSLRTAFDPTFERYARADKDGGVSVRRVADDGELCSWSGPPAPTRHHLCFSPDGGFLQDRRAGRVRLYRLPAAEVVLDVAADDVETWAGPFSPDGRFFATAHKDKDGAFVAIYDLPSAGNAHEVQRLRTGLLPYFLAFAADSRYLAFCRGDVVRVLDRDAGKAAFPDLVHPSWVDWIAWHPDGRTLATVCEDRRIRLWDVGTGKLLLPPLVGHRDGGMIATFSPAGDCLLSNDWSGILLLWDPRTGRQLLQMQSVAEAWNRAGDLLAAERSDTRLRLLRVATHRPLLSLAVPGDGADRRMLAARVSPDGRLLFVTRADAVALVDWASHRELASIPLPDTWVVRFDAQDGLLTSGRTAGQLRWPVRTEPGTGRLHVGPPETLANARSSVLPGTSADGSVFAVPGLNRGTLVLHRRQDRRVTLGPREDVRICAVSPDGRWVATGNHWNTRGLGATVWDAGTGRAVKDFPTGELCKVAFSPPGGRWLLTTGGRYRLWKVGSWEEGPALAQPDTFSNEFAFSPDGRTLALAGGFSQVWLVDVESGAEIARLTVPEQTLVLPQCFSLDGAQLVAIGHESNLLYIWDLRALRGELRELALDWDRPDYPPAEAKPPMGEVRVRLGPIAPSQLSDGADLQAALDAYTNDLLADPADGRAFYHRGLVHELLNHYQEATEDLRAARKTRPKDADLLEALGRTLLGMGKHAEAVDALQQALAVHANHARACNLLAWIYVAGPAALRDPPKALPLAQRAVEKNPTLYDYQNTLGVVYYRLGNFASAIEHLKESVHLNQDRGEAFDLYFLAMSAHQFGDGALARDYYDRALRWQPQTKLTPSQLEDLNALGAEASALLAIRPGPFGPPPAHR